MTDTLTKAEQIARLNDQLRSQNSQVGGIHLSRSVGLLPPQQQQQLLQLLKEFNSFSPDNDPYGERDFVTLELDGDRYFFKIDYFEKSAWLKGEEIGANSPEDVNTTWRVGTLMESSEY
ncbi:MAG TPA: DUF3768 domain-containing protein [Candidatus Obscuribacterales bacterium]